MMCWTDFGRLIGVCDGCGLFVEVDMGVIVGAISGCVMAGVDDVLDGFWSVDWGV